MNGGNPSRLGGVVTVTAALVMSTLAPAAARSQTSVTARLDNDFFSVWIPSRGASDREYTHGHRLSLVRPGAPWFGIIRAEPCAGQDPDGHCGIQQYAIGQETFTPRLDNLSPQERPYFGWLYVEAGGALVGTRDAHQFALVAGVTGQPSLAEAAQQTYHRLLGVRIPTWDDQIPFEPGLELSYDYLNVPLRVTGSSATEVFAAGARGGAKLGNIRTNVYGGAQLWVGHHVPTPLQAIAPDKTPFALFVTARFDGRVVLRDVGLDGSTFTESVSVDRRTWVPEVSAGVELRRNDVRIGYFVTVRGREYDTQPLPHRFGRFVLTLIR